VTISGTSSWLTRRSSRLTTLAGNGSSDLHVGAGQDVARGQQHAGKSGEPIRQKAPLQRLGDPVLAFGLPALGDVLDGSEHSQGLSVGADAQLGLSEQHTLNAVVPGDAVFDVGEIVVVGSSECLLDVGPNSRSILGFTCATAISKAAGNACGTCPWMRYISSDHETRFCGIIHSQLPMWATCWASASCASADEASATRAAKKNEQKATVALNAWSMSIFSSSVPAPNGPAPLAAAHEAVSTTSRAAGAAPRCRNRQAAHPSRRRAPQPRPVASVRSSAGAAEAPG
jgi:hypothetical protein